MPEYLFISDLHLSPERPGTTSLLLRFLRERAVHGSSLFILGDLFDAWVGDDDRRPPIPEILAAMKQLTDVGTRLFFIAGNRDFLVGDAFVKATGCHLLPDTHLIELAGTQALLMHGDLLCSDDRDYQQLRGQLRSPAFIGEFLSKPLEQRIALATEYRKRSGEAVSLKAADIVDANQSTVENYLRDAQALLLIHGHTHRPANHRFRLDGADAVRVVLPEWQAYCGGYLSVCGNSISRHVFV
ncbi:MAG: UDP-2,3-diacylglucosamine diphosphatase [Gammaproteobacteria bacterium]|nr:UDP-2,3-diacylglucosamine diphosphatase [Gammaproteobacteria bacterium]